MMKTKSALSYFGSDAMVAQRLAALLEDCKHVTIPFVGGASILPHLKARAIVANDLHAAALNFYRVLSGEYGTASAIALIQQCRQTLSHPTNLEKAKSIGPSHGVVLNAWAFWTLCWLGRKGKGGTKHMGGMPSVRWTGKGGTNATRVQAAAADLEEWAEHFKRCEWEQICFRDLLPKVADDEDCGIYCDPPWVGAGRNYLYSFSEQDHRDLAELLRRFEKTVIVVRYGDDPLIRELYPKSSWTWVGAESRTQANKMQGEVWITRRANVDSEKET